MPKIRLFFLLIFISVNGFVFSQVTADFSATTPTSGCSPLQVTFEDASAGTIVKREWDFGNGIVNTTGNLTTAYTQYSTPGQYTVKLTVYDASNNSDTKTLTNYITVFQNPVANFTANGATTGCKPLNVSFTSTSTQGSAAISQYVWDYGDGNLGGGATGTHAYNVTGYYNVSLQVIDANGCKDDTTFQKIVRVSSEPNVVFATVGPNVSCTAPFTVDFNNTSTSFTGSNFTSSWILGNGNTSTDKNPTGVTYNALGAYSVSLTVTDTNGCSKTLTKPNYVQIVNTTANFETRTGSLTGPINDTVCTGSVVFFKNTSVSAITYSWDLGTGTFTTASANPQKTFTTAGVYTIRLAAMNGLNCKDTVVKTLVVEDLTYTADVNPTYVCNVPKPVNFTGTASAISGIASSVWTFGYNINNIPVSSGLLNTTHTYINEGIYPITLTLTSNAGCVKTYKDTVKIFLMYPDFKQDKEKGCAPLTVSFTDKSTPVDTAVLWTWNFGDGTIIGPGPGNDAINGSTNTIGTYSDPVHTYENIGEYDVTMTITNAAGCSESFTVPKAVKVGKKPSTDFSYTPALSCAFDPIQFTDLTVPTDSVDEWIWSFGDTLQFDGNLCGPVEIPGSSSEQNPLYTYQDTGWMSVTLISGYRGCYDTLQVEDAIYIKGVVAYISSCYDCEAPRDHNFDAVLINADKFVWDFGDGSPKDSVNLSSTHIYPANADYAIELVAYDNATGCSFTATKNLRVKEVTASFVYDPHSACNDDTIAFNGYPSLDVWIVDGYSWDFGDGTTFTSNFGLADHTYSEPGVYNVELTVTDQNGCQDSVIHSVKIYQPIVDFVADTLGGCLPLPVSFTDATQSDTTLVSWQWSLGDGFTANTQNTDTTYSLQGNKDVKLIVTDILGCKDSLTKPAYIKIAQITVNLFTTDNKLCAGETTSFVGSATSSNGAQYLTYLWDFGNGNSATILSPLNMTFADSGTFNVSFTATDTLSGCFSSKTSNNMITVHAIPEVDFIADKLSTNCYPDTISLSDLTALSYADTYEWYMSDGWTASGPNPKRQFTAPGVYDVTLKVTTISPFLCQDSIVKPAYITINGPLATFTYDKDTICQGDEVTFSIDNNQDGYYFTWNFGDGTPAGYSYNPDDMVHEYLELNQITPSLIYFASDSTCKQIATNNSLMVYQVIADFTTDTLEGCQPFNVNFANTSGGNDVPNLNYAWNFGNGLSDTNKDGITTFNDEGTYTVQLISTNPKGCDDTISKQVVVYPIPAVSVGTNQDICYGDTIQLTGSGTGSDITYSWSPGETLNDSTITNPIAEPLNTTTYSFTVTTDKNCLDSKPLTVTVHQFPSLTISNDTSIIVGDTVWLVGTASGISAYVWTPSEGLSCTDCPNPVANPMVTTTYYATVSDPYGCGTITDSLIIEVKNEFNIAVPTAFTPGSETNNVIYVKGWGIKELLEFSIYNRWGQMVFQTNDIKKGWDGYYNGVLQNTETYVYVVKAVMHDGTGTPKIMKGNITLLR